MVHATPSTPNVLLRSIHRTLLTVVVRLDLTKFSRFGRGPETSSLQEINLSGLSL